MSLLMQALRKAERNKQDALPDEDQAAMPSEEFDRILALTPDDIIAGRVPPAPDAPAFSLEPLAAAEPAGGVNEQVPALEPAIPAPHDPTPRQSRRHGDVATQRSGLHREPALAGATDPHAPLEWTGDTAAASAARPASVPPIALDSPLPLADGTAPALSTAPIAPMPDFVATVAASAPPAHGGGPALEAQEALDAYASAGTATYSPHEDAPPRKHNAQPPDGGGASHAAPHHRGDGPATGSRTGAEAGSTAAHHTAASQHEPDTSRAKGTAARARAAAQAAAQQDQPRRDPARVRLAMLGGVLALVAGTLAGVYWYALTSPGPGASLPPVPMPAPGASTGPAPVTVVAPAAGQQDGQATPATDLMETTAPGASVPPHAATESLQPAAGYTGLPTARITATPRPHAGSRMPSDDDLQRALQQQAQASPQAPAPVEPPAGARQSAASNQGHPATPANVSNASNTANTPSNPAYSNTPPGGASTDIHVARGVAPQRINAALQDGYQAFMAGNYTSAAQYYASALRQDPNNRDALLGNSAIAARRNDIAAATSGYQRLLELNPNDADAQAGLLALRPGDPGQSELRLKDLLRRDPGAGPLEFALGNLYAQQGRWPDAQQAYFRAYSATPDNADYAFNLAVGLDRLSQRKLALTYYQRALDLSRTSPAAFDRTAARRRADQLAAPAGTQPGVQPGPPSGAPTGTAPGAQTGAASRTQSAPGQGGTPAPVTPAIPSVPAAAFTPPPPPDTGAGHGNSSGIGSGIGNGHRP